jgi:hypothetical protein
MSNEFLPKDYAAPTTSDIFMTLKKGDSNFRILSPAVLGYEYWTNDTKVVRSKEFPKETPNIRVRLDEKKQKEVKDKPKHFWAFKVWNYDEKAVQVLLITQKSIQQGILNLVNDEDWGNPLNYDIKITRDGEKFTTKYSMSPKPKKPLTKEVLEAIEKAEDIDIEQLYFGNKNADEEFEGDF